jgi:hypothetical protein
VTWSTEQVSFSFIDVQLQPIVAHAHASSNTLVKTIGECRNVTRPTEAENLHVGVELVRAVRRGLAS